MIFKDRILNKINSSIQSTVNHSKINFVNF